MSDFYSSMYNPDVLTCLANLSNDEVFTLPEVANRMLDMLPEELWHDSSATFLDPACKSGVFLREIAKRLIEGLKEEIPDLQERIDHIFQAAVWYRNYRADQPSLPEKCVLFQVSQQQVFHHVF